MSTSCLVQSALARDIKWPVKHGQKYHTSQRSVNLFRLQKLNQLPKKLLWWPLHLWDSKECALLYLHGCMTNLLVAACFYQYKWSNLYLVADWSVRQFQTGSVQYSCSFPNRSKKGTLLYLFITQPRSYLYVNLFLAISLFLLILSR